MQPIEICYKFVNHQPDIITHNEFLQFCNETNRILTDRRTWSSFLVSCDGREFDALPIKLVPCKSNHKCKGLRLIGNSVKEVDNTHVTIALVTDNYVMNVVCPDLEKGNKNSTSLSCTRFSNNYEIFINKKNWENGFKLALMNSGHYNCIDDVCKPTKQFPSYYSCFLSNPELIVSLYREYVINHEMGHALGRGHFIPKFTNSNKNELIPIMAQQTKGLFNYKINTWPLPEENCIVAENNYAAIKKYIIPL